MTVDDDYPSCWLHVSEAERADLEQGLVPARVQRLAASLSYAALNVLCISNAAKPTVPLPRRKKGSPRD